MGVRLEDIHDALTRLGERRPIFHSEADFQHELAIEIRNFSKQIETRLEVPFSFEGRGATDLVLRTKDMICGVELKYLTRAFSLDVDGEKYQLAQHGAHPLRRYDVVKDIRRLEQFNQRHGGPSFLIALTNDSAYWNINRSRLTVDAAFRVCEGSIVSGILAWSEKASAGTTKGRTSNLDLIGTYTMKWRDYSDLNVPGGKLKYLLVKVD